MNINKYRELLKVHDIYDKHSYKEFKNICKACLKIKIGLSIHMIRNRFYLHASNIWNDFPFILLDAAKLYRVSVEEILMVNRDTLKYFNSILIINKINLDIEEFGVNSRGEPTLFIDHSIGKEFYKKFKGHGIPIITPSREIVPYNLYFKSYNIGRML